MLTVLQGGALEKLRELPAESVQCCVTSPPYWGLRDYGVPGQIGLEETPSAYVAKMVEVFREVWRVIKNDGTLWLNLGDSYAATPVGLNPKNLIGIPWRVAFAIQEDGWYLRSDIIWAKPNPMPESVTDRPTKAHEYIFLLSKRERYFYDAEAIKEDCTWRVHLEGRSQRPNPQCFVEQGGKYAATRAGLHQVKDLVVRNKRSVWTVATAPYPEAHFATYPPDLIKPCVLAGTKPGDVVLDPFAGSGTTGMVAIELGRLAVLVELNPEYIGLIEQRCNVTPGFAFAV